MRKRSEAEIATLLRLLSAEPAARLVAEGDGRFRLVATAGRVMHFSETTVRRLRASGLIVESEPEKFAASSAAAAWMKRQNGGDRAFRMQHGKVVAKNPSGDPHTEVLVDLDESPIAALSRRATKSGEAWLAPHATAAAERFRRDFEIGRLQPRVTANWSASVSTGRRSGDGSGVPDLTDMALSARLRFDRAMRDVGPELAGVLVDVCCFLKGLETVERERQWPARSAKLVLKIALESLARHYGLTAEATGSAASRGVRHWGAEDFRPEIT